MENFNLEKIGMELKRLRTENDFTQEQFAKELGCTISFISNIENNRAKLNLRVLTYYAKLCNVTVDSILAAGESDTDSQKHSATRDAEVINIFHQFLPEEQDRILKVLKYLKSI